MLIHVTVMVHNVHAWCLGDIHTVGVICTVGLYKLREQDNLSNYLTQSTLTSSLSVCMYIAITVITSSLILWYLQTSNIF